MGKVRIFFVFVFFASVGQSQVSYYTKSSLLSPSSVSSFCVGFTDVDGDHKDDFVLLSGAKDLHCFFQNGNLFSLPFAELKNAFPQEPWTVCSGDLDNDGIPEYIVAGEDNGLYVFQLFPEPKIRQFLDDQFFAQASNFVDINNDGWLDLFVCNDVGTNAIYINNGQGVLEQQNDLIDFTTVPSSDKSGNYGSEWIDVDNDGDLDLSIAKCKEGVDDTNDARRINMLFINKGNGQFVNEAQARNADIHWQSWTGSWADFDNDGDLDCYVVNHDRAHFILENNGAGNFTHIEEFIGEPFFGGSIQSLPFDYDNDGDVDVLITGLKDHILWNNGNFNFSKEESPFPTADIYSAAIGDINDDGFLDVLASNVLNYLSLGTDEDDVFVANPNTNNYVKFSLQGAESNMQGVGAQLHIYGDWGTQRRDVKAGESYGVVNSKNVHFGLGSHASIDSLNVIWPSGVIDRHYNLLVNKNYIIHENECLVPFIDIEVTGALICPGDLVQLSIPTNGQVTWSDGFIGKSRTVFKSGSYKAKISDNGCNTFTNILYLNGPSNVSQPQIIAKDKGYKCVNDKVELSIEPYDIMIWSTGEQSQNIEVSQPGWYAVSIGALGCSDLLVDSLEVVDVSALGPLVVGDTIDLPGDVTLMAAGEGVRWFNTMWSSDILHEGNMYTVFADASRKYYASAVNRVTIPPSIIGHSLGTSNPVYGPATFNNGLYFKAHQACKLSAVSVVTDMPGERQIELRDLNGVVLDFVLVDVVEGTNRLTLDFALDADQDYFLTTDANTNLNNISQVSPQFVEIEDATYPYSSDNRISILDSKNGSSNIYPYFFGWEIDEGSVSCTSERVDVSVVVGGISGLYEKDVHAIELFPNPMSTMLSIRQVERPTLIEIFNLDGVMVGSELIKRDMDLNQEHLLDGIYLVKLTQGNQTVTKRMLKFTP